MLWDKQGKTSVYQVTDDADAADVLPHIPFHTQPELAKAHAVALKGNKHQKKKLERWIAQYPDLPHFKNYLAVWYSVRNEPEKSFAYNREILKQHPDYLYAKLNLAKEHLYDEEPEKVPAVLGLDLELEIFAPERKVFHIDEYSLFYKTVVEYWCAAKEPQKAELVFDELEKAEKEWKVDFRLLSFLSLISETKRELGIEEPDQSGIERTEPTLPQTVEDPTFQLPQMHWLNENGFDISIEKIDALLGLERNPLITDLETVVCDAIKRYNYFNSDASGDAKNDFCLHALFLLKGLDATESLPAVLELLRQPDRVLDFWLGDTVTETIWQVIYTLGNDQLDALEAYLKERLNHSFARGAVSAALVQLALHQPERRPEVLEVYQRLIHFYEANKTNREVVDPEFLGLMTSDLIDLKATELHGDLKKLYDADLVDESISGDWQEVEDQLYDRDPNLANMNALRPLKNIYELYEELQSYSGEPPEPADDWEFEEAEEEEAPEGPVFYSSHTPYVREDDKIGRNDPCPCGSGLKYKKCHGK